VVSARASAVCECQCRVGLDSVQAVPENASARRECQREDHEEGTGPGQPGPVFTSQIRGAGSVIPGVTPLFVIYNHRRGETQPLNRRGVDYPETMYFASQKLAQDVIDEARTPADYLVAWVKPWASG
jgi:hypothetical protein